LIYPYFKDNQYPARKSVLFMWFLPILLMIYLSFIFNYDGVDVLVQIRYHLVHLINISLMGALLCYSLSHLCTETLDQRLTKMNNKEEGSK
ncbi:MAG: hypothetical protein JXC31_00095, partial [Acholeplasmataceae bacterium]|nr:hypothetical protein [Acholeplasmataceae bacterium]